MHFTVSNFGRDGRMSLIARYTWTFFYNGVRNSLEYSPLWDIEATFERLNKSVKPSKIDSNSLK